MAFLKFLTTVGVTTTTLIASAQIIGLPSPKVAQAQADPTSIRQCVNGLVYKYIFSDGTPNGNTQTGMPSDLATVACRSINSSSEAQQMRKCVNGLVYKYIFSDGTPNGDSKTGTGFAAAVNACSPNTNLNQQPLNNTSGTNININVGQPIHQQSNPQAVAQCMQNLMYTEVQLCQFGTDPWGRCLGNFTYTETRRTEISESFAAQACQNAI